MSKILVTGGAGFIGSHLIKRLLTIGFDVVCVDNFNNYYDPKIKEQNVRDIKKNRNFKLYREDILNFDGLCKIFKKEKPAKICHLAARAGVRPSIQNPDIYVETNVKGTLNLLNLAVKYDIHNFIFASSSSVYGNNKKIPFSEDDRVDEPISPYAATKKASELLVYNYHYLHKLNCTILRFFTVYGPSGRPDMAPYSFTDAIYKGKIIRKFGNGKSKRDYTYIEDIIDGVVSALNKNFSYEIINLGNNKPVELNYFITLIEKLVGKKAVIQQLSKQPGDVDITYADISKAKRLLDYVPKIPIEVGMEKFTRWYLNYLLKNKEI